MQNIRKGEMDQITKVKEQHWMTWQVYRGKKRK